MFVLGTFCNQNPNAKAILKIQKPQETEAIGVRLPGIQRNFTASKERQSGK
jgi:hypothetical protein